MGIVTWTGFQELYVLMRSIVLGRCWRKALFLTLGCRCAQGISKVLCSTCVGRNALSNVDFFAETNEIEQSGVIVAQYITIQKVVSNLYFFPIFKFLS
jgi:hypothetical protein